MNDVTAIRSSQMEQSSKRLSPGKQGDCPMCRGTLHILEAGRWVRCQCAEQILIRSFINPRLRRDDAKYPERYGRLRPWPLRDLYISGATYDEFRYMAWRSLEAYRDEFFRYEVMSAYRLVNIWLGKDSGPWTTLLDFEEYDLMIIDIGFTDLPNKEMGNCVVQLVEARRRMAKPTWVLIANQHTLMEAYGSALVSLLKPIVRGVEIR